jgi:hypothetical protein
MKLIEYGTFGHRQERGNFISLNHLSRFSKNTPAFEKIPGLGAVTMEVDVPEKANGVLYALGVFSGGLTCFVKDGVLNYEYNRLCGVSCGFNLMGEPKEKNREQETRRRKDQR